VEEEGENVFRGCDKRNESIFMNVTGGTDGRGRRRRRRGKK
jgi:hypothetical protein